jgi:hypothetical protein
MQRYEMLLKGAKKIYEERNQSKNSIRSRKETTTNNQRLLSTANKPKMEIKNIDGIVPLSIQK